MRIAFHFVTSIIYPHLSHCKKSLSDAWQIEKSGGKEKECEKKEERYFLLYSIVSDVLREYTVDCYTF